MAKKGIMMLCTLKLLLSPLFAQTNTVNEIKISVVVSKSKNIVCGEILSIPVTTGVQQRASKMRD